MGPNLGRFLGVLEQKLAGKRPKIDDLWLDVGSFLLWDGLSPAPLRRFLIDGGHICLMAPCSIAPPPRLDAT
jgi:hypothetical protein